MTEEPPSHRVEVTFVGRPPARQVARASGVAEVETDGCRLRCLVSGSFQPFLEALRGYEVTSLSSTPELSRAERRRQSNTDTSSEAGGEVVDGGRLTS
jgi:hypothetical protein